MTTCLLNLSSHRPLDHCSLANEIRNISMSRQARKPAAWKSPVSVIIAYHRPIVSVTIGKHREDLFLGFIGVTRLHLDRRASP